MWGEVSSLKFKYVDPTQEVANILITHDDLGGKSGTVGWAESPRVNSDPATSKIVMDNREQWRARQLDPNPQWDGKI